MDTPQSGKKRLPRKRPRQKPEENIDDILDSWSNDIDSIGIKLEKIKDIYLKKLRLLDSDLADDLEANLIIMTSEGHYGVGVSGYTKVNVLRPIQRKYRK